MTAHNLTERVAGLLLLLLLIGLAPVPGRAAPSVGSAGVEQPTAERIEARVKDLDAAEGMDESLKSRLRELYRQALGYLESARAQETARAGFEQAIESAPAQTDALQRALLAKAPAPSLEVSPDTPVSELEQQLVRLQSELATRQGRVQELEERLKLNQDRPAEARRELTVARQTLDAVQSELQAQAPAGEAVEITEARRLILQARVQNRSAEIARLEQELVSLPLRVQLLTSQRDTAAREAARTAAQVSQLQELINLRRRVEAEQARAQTRQTQLEVATKDPLVRRLAEENAALGRELTTLAAALEEAGVQYKQADKKVGELEQDLQSVRRRLEIAGLSQGLGRVLQEERQKLRTLRDLPVAAADREQTIAREGLAQLRTAEQRRALADLDQATTQELEAASARTLPEARRAQLQEDVRGLLRDRRDLLDKLQSTRGAYLRALGDLDFAQKRLADTGRLYASFLAERLLWVPSASAFGLQELRDLGPAAAWMLDPGNWLEVLDAGSRKVRAMPVSSALAVLTILALVAARKRMRARLRDMAARVGKVNQDRFVYTPAALGLTVLLAAPVPLLLWVLGSALTSAPQGSEFVKAMGRALLTIAPLIFYVRTLMHMCRPDGIAAVHFGWVPEADAKLRRELRWFLFGAAPVVFLAAALGEYASEAQRGSLGRLAFITAVCMLGVLLARVLHPGTGVVGFFVRDHPASWLARLRYLWYPVAAGAPFVLAVLAMLGYYYSAAQLAMHMVDSLWLLVGTVIAHGLAVRWLKVAHRRLALQQAREKRESLKAARAAAVRDAEEPAGEEGNLPPIEEPEVDLGAIDVRTRHLLRTVIATSALVGLWVIWAGVLPALGILDQTALWSYTGVIDGEERQLPVTLADLGLAVVLVVVTVVAARNLPAVLEIALLQRLPLEYGTRYAIGTIASYGILGLGIAAVFNTIGGSWSQIQWLVAALGVGLGFGLQEIFGNFVSGLIMLFERPVRVGDTVTVGDLTGQVSRIRMRATTILDWDRKEIIVPNKAFITERVINWTLSDPITRIVIPVGVAYGSDTALTQRAMLEAVKSVPLVRAEPPPQVYFVGFGESSLDFKVYAFVSELTQRLPMTHEVHVSIERALRANGIEIPFPQRDIHVRSTGGLRGGPGPAGDRAPAD